VQINNPIGILINDFSLKKLQEKRLVDLLIIAINNHEKIIFQSLEGKKFTSKEIASIKRKGEYLLCETNGLGIFGIRGLISDINIQENLRKSYREQEQKLLFFLSNIITNRLIHCGLNWLCNYSVFYKSQILKKDYAMEFGYWNAFNSQKTQSLPEEKILIWRKTTMCIKVGQSMTEGVIGHKKLVLLGKEKIVFTEDHSFCPVEQNSQRVMEVLVPNFAIKKIPVVGNTQIIGKKITII
jgi:hypothetical protein